MPRYNPQGQTRVYWVTTLSAPTAPTVAQIAAGVRLDPFIVPDSISGFTAEGQSIDSTDLASTESESLPGLATTTNGAITCYRGNTAGDAEADLLDDFNADLVAHTSGWVVFVLNGAPAATKLADVWPAQVNSVNPTPPAGGTAGRFTVGFTHPAKAQINVAIAA